MVGVGVALNVVILGNCGGGGRTAGEGVERYPKNLVQGV
jgi:hypothetical protein